MFRELKAHCSGLGKIVVLVICLKVNVELKHEIDFNF